MGREHPMACARRIRIDASAWRQSANRRHLDGADLCDYGGRSLVRRRRLGEVRRLWRPVRGLTPRSGTGCESRRRVAGDDGLTAPGAGRDGLDDQGRRSVPITGMSPTTPPAPAMTRVLL